MAIFLINAVAGEDAARTADFCATPRLLDNSIEKGVAETDRMRLNQCSWLVAFKGTASELSAKLGIKEGQDKFALVTGILGIAGYGRKEIAEWISNHQGV